MKRLELLILLSSAVASMWASSYVTGVGVTPSALLAGIAVYLAVLRTFIRRTVLLVPDLRRLLLVALCLLTWTAFIYGVFDVYSAGGDQPMQIALGIGIAWALYVIVDSPSLVKLFVYTIITGAVVSGFVGIGQHFVGEPFISLWRASGEVTEQSLRNVRVLVPGFAPTSILLGYQLAVAIPLAVALLLSLHRTVRRTSRVLLAGAIATMTFGLVLTGSRSAIASGFLGSAFAVFLLCSRTRRWRHPLLRALVLSSVLYVVVGYLYGTPRLISLADRSAAVRVPVALSAIRYALDHPMGTGFYHLTEAYLPPHLDPSVVESVLSLTPHNQFLNVLVYYGFLGLGLLVAFYWVVLKGAHDLWRAVVHHQCDNVKWTVAGISGSLLAYLLNSSFHNAGPFVGDRFHWYLIGLLFSIQRIAASSFQRESPRGRLMAARPDYAQNSDG